MLRGKALLEPLRCGTVSSLLSLAVTLKAPAGRATRDIVFVVDEDGGDFVLLNSSLPSLHYPNGSEARWLGLCKVEVSDTCAFMDVSYGLVSGWILCDLMGHGLGLS